MTPTVPDTNTVKVTVTDDDAGSDSENLTLVVNYANIQAGICCADPSEVALAVGSLTENDRIHVNPVCNDGTLQVTITNRVTGAAAYQQTFAAPPGGFGQIAVFGQGADDYIQIADSISVDACVQGGAGNDNMKGGSGNDILIGGAGDDLIVGGNGRDLMIGGTGADRIVGNADEDILVAGATAYDANSAALCAIMAEWTSTSSYADRVAHLMGSSPGGMNAAYVLKGDDGAGQTVFNDNEVDTQTGSSGQDWFFANQTADNGGVLDKVTDQAINELFCASDF